MAPRVNPRNELLSPVRREWASLRNDPLVSTREAASLLGVSVWTLRRYHHIGLLRGAVRGHHGLRFRQSSIRALLKKVEV
jgi:Helix-turn-helix domain